MAKVLNISRKVVEIKSNINIVPISQEELEVISRKINGDQEVYLMVNNKRVETIIAYGYTDPSDSREGTLSTILRSLIPYKQDRDENGKATRNYKCFQGRGTKTTVIVHEEVGSAINCLNEVLRYPEIVLIFN